MNDPCEYCWGDHDNLECKGELGMKILDHADVVRALLVYTCNDDIGLSKREFLRLVASRIEDDLSQIERFKLANVASVYSGKRDACMCGCKGKYSYASAHRDWAAKNRGYEISDDEVSDRSVKTIFNKILEAGPIQEHAHQIYANVGGRSYVANFREED